MGPYPVGFQDLDIEGHEVAIFYPTTDDRDACSGDLSYDMRQFLPEEERDLISDDDAPFFDVHAHMDAPPNTEDQYPLVFFSHGLAGYRLQSSTLLAHLASWGMVVVSAEQPERNLSHVLTEFAPDGDNAPDTLATLVDVFHAGSSDDPDLDALIAITDADRLAATGHSMGGNGAQSLLDHPSIDAAIFFASSIDVPADDPDANPHDAHLMWQAGGTDRIITANSIRRSYEDAGPPRTLVDLEEAGHLAFSDLCAIGADRGGILQIADDAGLDINPLIVGLGEDGCRDTDLAPDLSWPIIHHYAVAHLRYAFQIDEEPMGLDTPSLSCFDDTVIELDRQPL